MCACERFVGYNYYKQCALFASPNFLLKTSLTFFELESFDLEGIEVYSFSIISVKMLLFVKILSNSEHGFAGNI